MQVGQPQETLEEDGLLQLLCLGSLYNQSLDTGCPRNVAFCNKRLSLKWVAGEARAVVLSGAGQHVPPQRCLHGASLCPSHDLFLLSSAGPG